MFRQIRTLTEMGAFMAKEGEGMVEEEDLIDQLVRVHGEDYRTFIEDSLRWLDENEPKWQLGIPLNRKTFIWNLIEHVHKEEKRLINGS